MANEFQIEVPITVKGDRGKKIGDEIAESINKKLQSIGFGKGGGKGIGAVGAAEVGIAGGATGMKMLGTLGGILAVVESIDYIVRPVFALLKATLALLFLPLLPILKPVLQAWAALIKIMVPFIQKSVKGWEMLLSGEVFRNLWERIKEGFTFAWDQLKKAWNVLLEAGNWIWENILKPGFDFLTGVGMMIWDNIIYPGFESVLSFGIWIWELFVQGLNNVANFGKWIWEKIVAGLSFIADLGSKIWEWLKNSLSSIGDLGERIWNVIKGALSFLNPFGKRAAGGPVSANAPYLVGEKGPELFVPTTSGNIVPNGKLGGSFSVTINNPVVRSETDIKKIANEVSKVFRRELTGRVSSGF